MAILQVAGFILAVPAPITTEFLDLFLGRERESGRFRGNANATKLSFLARQR